MFKKLLTFFLIILFSVANIQAQTIKELEKKELDINLQLWKLQIKLNELVPKKDKIKVKDEIKPIVITNSETEYKKFRNGKKLCNYKITVENSQSTQNI